MFSKGARWSSSHKYIQAIVFSKGSYSIGLNSSLLYQITFHRTCSLLITRDISGCFLGRGGSFLSCIFVGHAYKILPTTVWVSVSSCFFGRGPAETQGRVCLCGFSVMHSLTRHSRQISLHTHIVVFSFFLSLSLCILSFVFCLRGQRTTKSLVATFSNLFQPVRWESRV